MTTQSFKKILKGDKTLSRYWLTVQQGEIRMTPTDDYLQELITSFSTKDVRAIKNKTPAEMIAIAESRGWPAFTIDDWSVLTWHYELARREGLDASQS